jgi:alcohol dehydrogenase (cytochrome c)
VEADLRNMQNIRKLRRLFSAAGLILLILAGAAAAIPTLRWRAIIIFDKASGRLVDIDWSDLNWMLRPRSGIYLEPLADKENPFLVIESPRSSKGDLEAGQHLFLNNCSPCHGDQGRGGQGGPSLQDRVFRQGRSDWALYRTITLGVPGTAMVSRNLPRDDVWRLVSYLTHTILAQGAETMSTLPSLKPVTAAEIRNAGDDPAEWLTYSGSYASTRHSLLHQINRDNIGQLRVEWDRQFSSADELVETSPIIRGTTMFVTEPPSSVLALDAASGRVLWTYSRDLPPHLLLCCGTVNRGVALLGNRVFVGTLDAHLIALDATTGKVVWDVGIADSSKGYSITGAPLVVDDMIVTGIAGGEYGIRGFLNAYDAASGKLRWRFDTIPEAGQPGSETWTGNSSRSGGAPTWLTGSFDPESRLIYWGVGNPSPNFYGGDRQGDNRYSNSVVALDADSGKLRWSFQFSPHDTHDWDSVQIPVLVDTVLNGSNRKLLIWANRNGFYYLLDRTTGEFLQGTPFVKQTWADGLDAKGRPRVRPESIPSPQGSNVYPSITGGTNWWSPTYDPELKMMYVPTIEQGGIFFASPDQPPSPEGYILGSIDTKVPNENLTAAVKALDVTTGAVRWQYARSRNGLSATGGLMSTAGGIVFGSDLESFFALDARTGAALWHFEAGGRIAGAPVTYEVDGRQYVAVAAGRSILTFALPQAKNVR